jgi:peptidoglycan DL-endopeptidase CwlO
VVKTASRRRGLTAAVAMVGAAVVFLASPARPAGAEPNEGGSKTLKAALESAARGYVEAKIKLDNSKKRQLQLTLQLRKSEQEAARLAAEVGAVAAKSYRLGRISTFGMLLNSGSPEAFLERVIRLDMMAQVDGRQLQRYKKAIDDGKVAKIAITQEVKEQTKQLNALAKKKQEAERALATVGGQPRGGFISVNSPLAKPAPRNSDGSWPRERCTIDDPTTPGCITPRTLHALRQAKSKGFNHHVSCHRGGGGGEHPKGRACDFAAARGGFENRNASGSDKRYGDRLASFYVKNANRLGVMYVIWYRQVWMPGTGWRSYSGSGSPAASHTNHVHLSML